MLPEQDIDITNTDCNKMLSQQIIDNLKEHILLLTLKKKVLSSNKNICKFFNISKKSENDESIYSNYFMSSTNSEQHLSAIEKVIETKKIVNFVNIMNKGSNKYIFEVTMSPIFKKGVLNAIIEVRKDISEKMILENENLNKTVINKKKHSKSKKRILVMEDTFLIRELLVGILTNFGFNVSTVANGKLAIAEFANSINTENDYDLVILDLMVFDGLGGIETLEKLKKYNPKIKSIAMSGYENYNLTEIKDAGFDEFLKKPVDMYKLEQTIYDLILDT